MILRSAHRSIEDDFPKIGLFQQPAKEFQEPTIKRTIESVAANQAKTLLNQQIEPEVKQFQKETAKSIENVQQLTRRLEVQYRNDYKGLTKNVSSIQRDSLRASNLVSQLSSSVTRSETLIDDLNQRTRIGDLAAKAMIQADRASMQELNDIAIGTGTTLLKGSVANRNVGAPSELANHIGVKQRGRTSAR